MCLTSLYYYEPPLGKTNVMIILIEYRNGLKFRNVHIFSKSLFQSKYQYLEELLKPIKGIGYYSFNNCDIIPPQEVTFL